MSGQPTANMGLQLFPPPPRKRNPSRKPSVRRHAITPQSPPESAVERPESPNFSSDGRQSALDGRASAMGGRHPQQPERTAPQAERPVLQSGRDTPQTGRATPQTGRATPQTGRGTPQNGRTSPQPGRESPITVPSPVALAGADLPRSQTSFSEGPTLARSNSNASHSSIAKHPINNPPQRGEPILRSIFPKYNPELPLEHQPYYPTQTSPTHIPKTIINRRPYSPSINDRSAGGLQSPMAMGMSPGHFPRGVQDDSIMEPSTTEEMRELWKVTNGWRVSASEGRRFCLRMTSAVDEPVHTLSSSTQAFYTLHLVPTSTSAQMTMTRQDPSKQVSKGSNSPMIGNSSKINSCLEVLSTTLEEIARRLPPNDGLVALLYPRAASNMAIELANKSNRADDTAVLAAAERECGRLVWDEDSQRYYLVHPALVTPFVISISSSPAWSRVEYTLEHSELPRNLVRLVRDGTGSGFLEVDTAVASRIDCFYIVDVAICAVLLVALAEEKTRNVERFDAPPSIAPSSPMIGHGKGKGKKAGQKEVKIEEFEMDLESQNSVKDTKEKAEKVPGFFGLIWMLLKCMVWSVVMVVKGLAKIIIFATRCLSKRKS